MLEQKIDSIQHPQLARAWQLLSAIPDPEIPALSIVELGMVRGVAKQEQGWVVTFTPTYSGCPATDMLVSDITRCLTENGFDSVSVETSLDPAWTTDWLNEESKRKLREFGIAPPDGKACTSRPMPTELACPHCGSTDTQLVSEFGSTACKAHYKCRACYEPFDYFKCI